MERVRKNFTILIAVSLIMVFIILLVGCATAKPKVAVRVITDDAYSDSSSPAAVIVNNSEGETVASVELPPNQKSKDIELDEGTYTARIVCPLNNDGTYYTCDYSNKFDIDKNNKNIDASFDLTKVDFGNGSADAVKTIGDNLKEAVDKSNGEIDDSAMKRFNANQEIYNQKVAEAEQQAQKAAEEAKAAQIKATLGKVVGKWGAAFPGGGYRGSMTINSDGTGTITSWQAASGEKYQDNEPFTVQVVDLEPAAASAFGTDSIHIRCTNSKSSEDFIYVAKDDKLCPCEKTFKEDVVVSYNRGYSWVRA